MECLDFNEMSPLDLLAGMGVNPGCTPIKFSHCTNGEQIFEDATNSQNMCITSPQTVSAAPPSILRRGKHRRHRWVIHDEELDDQHMLEEESFYVKQELLTQPGPAQPLPTTPVRLPLESLPFSPSQFLNTSCQLSNDKRTSTPSSSQTVYSSGSFSSEKSLTPRNQHVVLHSVSPHTPTPFKHAMAEVERMAQSKLWSPSDLDDLGEVLKECDAGTSHNGCDTDCMGYEADQSSEFTPMSQAQQSRRKFSKEAANQRGEKKVQKKSAKKIMFTDSPSKQRSKVVILDPAYQKVACGLTKDQQDMTQLAKSYF